VWCVEVFICLGRRFCGSACVRYVVYVAPRCYAPKLLDLWVVAGVLPSLPRVFAPRLWRGVTWLVPWWGGGLSFCLVSPSLAWRAARRGFRRICREGVFYACRLFLSCLCGLLFVVVGCLVRLLWFLCAVWRGLFLMCRGAAACKHRWVYLGLLLGVGSEFLYRGVLCVCGF